MMSLGHQLSTGSAFNHAKQEALGQIHTIYTLYYRRLLIKWLQSYRLHFVTSFTLSLSLFFCVLLRQCLDNKNEVEGIKFKIRLFNLLLDL
jgi:hypothetical protein